MINTSPTTSRPIFTSIFNIFLCIQVFFSKPILLDEFTMASLFILMDDFKRLLKLHYCS